MTKTTPDYEKELAKLVTKNRLLQHSVDRWVPCADHRDKTGQLCYVCENERLRNILRKLVDCPHAQLYRDQAKAALADGRSFS